VRRSETELFSPEELQIYALISRNEGLRAREISRETGIDKTEVSRRLVSSALMRELCYQDSEYRWHALVRQQHPHEGLYEFSGWYGTVSEFMAENEETWLKELSEGCTRIGRNLNDTRGLIHSFRDCRETMRSLFADLKDMGVAPENWETVFELRINLKRFIRIYADVLLITPEKVFTLEFKMKNRIDPEEVLQAAKYVPYLEILFGKEMDVYPALVLTGASELFTYEQIGKTEFVLPVCSGDMLFNVFNEAMGFLG
jgi:hypothetical protein